MFRCYSYTIIRVRINLCLLKLQLLKQSIKIHRCVVNTVVVWLHSLTQSTAEQCNTQTPVSVSPANFDTIHYVLKILLSQYLTHCYSLQTQYMQPHHHRINRTPMYFNGLF